MRRREMLAVSGVGVAGLLSGCTDALSGGNGDGNEVLGDPEYVEGRPDPGGVSMEEMPDLSGNLTVYTGRSEPRIGELMAYIDDMYDDFELEVRYDSHDDLVAQIDAEAESPADVFYGSETQTMTYLRDEGYTVELDDGVFEHVMDNSRDPEGHWVGFTQRYRCVAYNTDAYDADELPDDIFAYAAEERFEDDIMWPYDQGSFAAFITAMRVFHGDEEARDWIRAMVNDQNVLDSPGGDSGLAQAVADGEVSVGLTNHYTLRDAPGPTFDITFTSGDAGAMFNVTGATVMDDADDEATANAFIEHLVSAEAQEYFATTTWEYPTIEGVAPIEEVPGRDEFEPPEFDLNELSDLEPTMDMLREEGVL